MRRGKNPMFLAPNPLERLNIRYTGALFGAVVTNQPDIVRRWCEKQSIIKDIDCRGPHDVTPLMLATSRNFEECMWWLLEGGADPDLEDEFGDTALSLCESTDAADVLLQHGADPLLNNCGWQALRLACMEGRLSMVKALLDRGLMPDMEPDPAVGDDPFDGPTPMMLAVFSGQLACVQQLSVRRASRLATSAWDPEQFGDDDFPGPVRVNLGQSVEAILTLPANHPNLPGGHMGPHHQAVLDFLSHTSDWTTALHHLEIIPPSRVRLLLRCGADIDAAQPPNGKCTPQTRAAQLTAHPEDCEPQGASPFLFAPGATAASVAEAATLVSTAASGWSRTAHPLFPDAARIRARTLLHLGYLLSVRFGGAEAACNSPLPASNPAPPCHLAMLLTRSARHCCRLSLTGACLSPAPLHPSQAGTEVWRALVLPAALDRSSSNMPTALNAAASAAACKARDAAREGSSSGAGSSANGAIPAAAAAALLSPVQRQERLRRRVQALFTSLTTRHQMPPHEAAAKAMQLASQLE